MHRDRAVENVHALRGKRWAYNEENSHSGFQLPEHFLAAHGLGANFFASKIRSGSHARSIELVLEGQADATGIDSWVLALWRDHHRHVAHELVEIGRIGPSPSPPLIAIDASPDEICAAQTELERLQHSARGREALTRAGISRFVRRVDADYDPIRTIARELASRSPR
jgi:ABC-type phosphate/phosphonate transport system substrate-binding protein